MYQTVYYPLPNQTFNPLILSSSNPLNNDSPLLSPISLSPTTVQMYSKLIDGLKNNIYIDTSRQSKLKTYFSLYNQYATNFNSKLYNLNLTSSNHIKRSGVILVSKHKDDLIKLLVVRGRTHNIYSFPKGRQNEDEKEEICASRELYEETGIYIPVDYVQQSRRCRIGKNTYFIIDVEESDYCTFHIRDRKEILDVGWKSMDELRKLECNKDIRTILTYPNKIYSYHKLVFQV